jgi:hypothetical protein
MEGGHMLNKLHIKSTMKQQDQASKDKSDALLCQAETRKTKSKPIEMHSHGMCLQTIENKTMLMHSNHRPKPMLPTMKHNKKNPKKIQTKGTRVDIPKTDHTNDPGANNSPIQ